MTCRENGVTHSLDASNCHSFSFIIVTAFIVLTFGRFYTRPNATFGRQLISSDCVSPSETDNDRLAVSIAREKLERSGFTIRVSTYTSSQ